MSTEFVGRRIVEARVMSNEELEAEGWDAQQFGSVPVFVLDDGTLIYPSRDAEGNGPGELFGSKTDGDGSYNFMVMIDAPEPVSLDNG
jgi:hypothetical protein